MRKVIVLAATIAALAGSVAAHQAGVRTTVLPTSLVVRDVMLIDGSGGTPRPHVDIVVRNGKVDDIVPAASSQEAAAADLVVNGRGLFAIPGLIDAHVHLSPAPLTERIADLRRTLNGGVTAVFDLAGDLRETSDLARMAIAGDIQAPAIYYAALMAGPAFFTDPRVVSSSLGFQPGEAPWAQQVTPETDMVRAVAAARGTGATALKLYAALDPAAVRRIADEGRKQGLRLVAHATVFPAKPSDLIAAGMNMLAHVAYLVWEGSPPTADFTRRATGDFAHVPPNAPEIERVLVSMLARNVSLNPTLWIFEQGSGAQDEVAGVRTVAGTDDMIDLARDPLPILHREIELLVSAAGLTPIQALLSATKNAAAAIGVQKTRGTLEPGKVADIVLLEANPAEDIRNTRKIRFVIKEGRVVFDAAESGGARQPR
jgi:imidazolonepropionase-like amidohydrolase